MPVMPSNHLDPSNAHLKAAGQRLQDARLAQDISVDTVMRELKVTRLQIAGIESGNPKSFYNQSFFIDLLKRYARLLNFSEPAIAKMISPPVIEEVVSPASESAPAPAPAPEQAAESVPVQAQEPVESTPPDEVVLAHPDSQAAAPKSSARLVGLMALVVLVGGGVALGLQMTQSIDPTPVATATTATTATAATAATAPAIPAASEAPAVSPSAAPVVAAVSTAAEPPAPAAPAAPAAASSPKPEAAKSEKPDLPKPSPESASGASDQAPAKTIVDTPMTLTAKQKSWIWVRDASDQVRQFGVAQGQTVKFDQLPIFIVVHDPTVFEVIIGNKVVPLVRNNDERNVARHTRTDLINFYKQ